MKKATIVGLSIAAVAGLAGMASAAPLRVSELVDRGGLGVSEIGQGGGGGSSFAPAGATFTAFTRLGSDAAACAPAR